MVLFQAHRFSQLIIKYEYLIIMAREEKQARIRSSNGVRLGRIAKDFDICHKPHSSNIILEIRR